MCAADSQSAARAPSGKPRTTTRHTTVEARRVWLPSKASLYATGAFPSRGSRVGVPVHSTGTNQQASASNQKRADCSSLRANVTASSNRKSIANPASRCRSSDETPSAETNREPPRCRSARSRATRLAFSLSET